MRRMRYSGFQTFVALLLALSTYLGTIGVPVAADSPDTDIGTPHIYHPAQWYEQQRQVSGFGSIDNLPHGSGPVMHSITAYAIFWDPSSTIPANYQSLINQFFGDLGGTAFYNIVTQYYDTSPPGGSIQNVATFGGVWVDTSNAYPRAGSATDPLTDQDIRDEVDRALTANSAWNPADLSKMYFVFTEKGIESCMSGGVSCTLGVTKSPVDGTQGYCAYHNYYSNSGHEVIYANMPYVATWDSGFSYNCHGGGFGAVPNNHDGDEEISPTSHELFEAVTDPEPNKNWTDTNCTPSSVGLCSEIGDKCAYMFGTTAADGHNVVLNGHAYEVQEEWSNAANDGVTAYSGCVFRYNANVDVGTGKTGSPNTVLAGQTITYTITVQNNDATFEATDLTMTDSLPANTTFVSLVPAAGWTCSTPSVNGTGTVSCTALSVPKGATAVFTLVVNVNTTIPAGTSLSNTASVTSSSADPDGSNDSASVTTQMIRPTKLVYIGDTNQDYHDAANVSFVLEDALLNTPLAGLPVSLTLGTQTANVTTDASGVAADTIVIDQIPGLTSVSAAFAGDSEYTASSDTEPFTINREETSLTYTGDTLIPNGQPVHLSGVLLEDGITPITGRLVTFTLGSGTTAQTCTGTTDATGTATCTIAVAAQPLGPGTVSAAFAGDAYYLPSSASASTIIFAFLDHGSFVVGDQSASGTVAFWGSQWWTANTVTGGPSPSAFKGFAMTVGTTPPSCGSAWTTAPGNSSQPPAPANVPSYMGVIVTNSAVQSGSAISGNVVAIIIVKTNPGYANNPGQPGSGTMLAVYCHS